MGLVNVKSDKFYHFYPSLVTVVGTKWQEKINFMPAAWNGGISFSPKYFYIAVSKKRFTYELLKESKSFSANFLDWKHLKMVHLLGSFSGSEVDKVKKFDVPVEFSGEFVYIPLSYAYYGCKVVFDQEMGDHQLIIGEVIEIKIDHDLFTEDEKPDLSKISPIFYLGKGQYVKFSPRKISIFD